MTLSPPPDDLTVTVIRLIADYLEVPVEGISSSATFEELGIDSLGGLTIVSEIEAAYDLQIPNDKAMQISTVAQAVAVLKDELEEGGSLLKA